MAAELPLLKAGEEGGMRTALVEELEAHLHTQAQLRIMTFQISTGNLPVPSA